MGDWAFPNAIAEQVKLTASLKGQHANRIEIRDASDVYPPFIRASQSRCFTDEGTQFYVPHEGNTPRDPFCKFCGGLIEER